MKCKEKTGVKTIGVSMIAILMSEGISVAEIRISAESQFEISRRLAIFACQ